MIRCRVGLGLLLILLFSLSACTPGSSALATTPVALATTPVAKATIAVASATIPARSSSQGIITATAPAATAAAATADAAPSELYPPPVPDGTATAPAETLPAVTPAITMEPTAAVTVTFDGKRAYEDLTYQMDLGPRIPGSEAHTQVVDWVQKQLTDSGWTVELQETTRMGHPIRNILAKRAPANPNAATQWVLIGAHFDSRMKADHDPDPAKRDQAVPGANDGASGVAVLLELARVLPKDLNQQIWLVFFDAEDQGELPGWDWLLGSRAVADALPGKPDAAIILDMIGDADLNIFTEQNSNPVLTKQIWDTAARLGYTQAFKPTTRWSMIDDHTPFLEKGIRAVDVIDFDYPAWHTTQDTADKVSAQSLQTVGDSMLHWLIQSVPK